MSKERIKWHVEKRRVIDLKEWPKNPRKITDKGLVDLVISIDKFGLAEPIIINTDNTICGGHGRKLALTKLGIKEIDCYVPDNTMTDKQFEELNIRLNKNIAGVFDYDILANEFEVDELLDWGFEPLELGITEIETIEPHCDEDEVPELKEDPITKRGDVWLLGKHRCMCGDSTMIDDVEKLMNGEKADMVFTDPPYGISYKSNWSKKFDEIKNDDEFLDFKPILDIVCEKNSPMYIWTSHQVFHIWRELFIDNYKSTIIWYKKFGGMGDLKAEYGHNYEMCLYLCNGRSEFIGDRPKAVWEIGVDNANDYKHPTQKPVSLAENALGHHNKNNIIDLFLGSGSTLIACEKTGKQCYGMELDEKYCDVIINRWQNYTDKKATLESSGQTYEELLNARK